MAKLVCVKCHKFLHNKKTGIAFEEGRPVAGSWKPYKLFQGDLYHCRSCGFELIVPAAQPVAEHFQEDYGKWASILRPMLLVDDC
jgi:hypothetical protein